MPRSFLRDRNGEQSVTNIELFFDLVYVYAVTQMSHHLVVNHTWSGAFQALILLGLVWLAWVYTTWVTNWLDPDTDPMRLLLVGLMGLSLVLSAALPGAFGRTAEGHAESAVESHLGDLGMVVAIMYVIMQVARSAYVAILLRDNRTLQLNFVRILSWSLVSGVFAIIGGAEHGHTRELMWVIVIAIDLLGGAVGFYTPGLGRTPTRDWTIDGGHFAERCQAFILIALGESLVVIGESLSNDFARAKVAAFIVALVGAIALWWVYFDRSGPAGAEVLAHAEDPGRLATSAYHWVHPIMIAGIIVTAAADEFVFEFPNEHTHGYAAWMMLGGTALFLIGHAAFTALIWHVVPWTRLAAVVVLAIFGLFATHVTTLWLGILTGIVVLAVCVTDRYLFTTNYAEKVAA